MKARVPAAILLIAALFLAACGGESDEEKAQKAIAEAIENAQKDLDKNADSGDDEDTSNDDSDTDSKNDSPFGNKSDSSSDSKDDSNDDSSDTSLPNFENMGECMEIGFGYAALGLASLSPMMGGEELSKSELDELKSTVADLTKKLPKEIQGDFAIVAEAYDIAANEGFMSKKAQAALESSEFNKANDKVAAYIEDLCG